MAYYNAVTLVGNLTRDPETRYLPDGKAISKVGLAVSRKYTTKDGGKGEEVLFVDCDYFGATAEVIAKYCRKGDPVLVAGRLRLDTWEKDGKKNSKITVAGDTVQFLGGRRDDGGAPAASAGGKAGAGAVAGAVESAASNLVDPDDSIPF